MQRLECSLSAILLMSGMDRSGWAQQGGVTGYLHKPMFRGVLCYIKLFIWYRSPNSHGAVKWGAFFVVWDGSCGLDKVFYMVLHVVVTGTRVIPSSIFSLRKEYIWRSESDMKPELADAVLCLNLNGKVSKSGGWLFKEVSCMVKDVLVWWAAAPGFTACSSSVLPRVWVQASPLSFTFTGGGRCSRSSLQMCMLPGFYTYGMRLILLLKAASAIL